MRRTHFHLGLIVSLLVAACGGGGTGNGADAGPADAGADAAPMITGNTAKGVLPIAAAKAQELMPGAVLFTIEGANINAMGEVDPASNQSSWKYAYLDLGNGKVLYLFYTLGVLHVDGPHPMNTETLKAITTDWDDSNDTLAKLGQNGYAAPDPTDVNWHVHMLLTMFVGNAMDPRAAVTFPFWNVTKLHTPPGMPVMSEDWWIAHQIDMMNWFLCDPMQCFIAM